jgi:dihydrofolate reductase
MRKTILYIACSLDGFIAGPNDNLDFLNAVHTEGEDYGYGEFIKTIDTVIMGRRTYDWVMDKVTEFPHADKKTYIITRQDRPYRGNITFYSGSIEKLIHRLKVETGLNIFIDGGAQVVNMMLKHQLIDEMIISLIPVILGDGTRLFQSDNNTLKLELVSTKTFDTGLYQLHYRYIKT